MGVKATFYPEATPYKLIEFDLVTPVSSRVNANAQTDLYSDAKEDWLANPALMNFEFPFTTIGGNELSDVLEAGDYYFLRTDLGWRIRPNEADHTFTLTGNVYPIDPADDIIVPTSSAATVATILERSQLTQTVVDQINQTASAVWATPVDGVVSGSFGEVMRSQAFNGHGKVIFDGDIGSPGTAWPLGTPKYPIDNFADAFTVARRENAPIVHCEAEGVLLATDDATGIIIEGHHPLKVQIQASAGVVTTNTIFREVYLRNASLDGWIVCRDAVLENITGFQGVAHQCMLNPGTVQITGAQGSHFLDCYSGQPGTSTPVIDMNGKNVDIGMRGYWGGIRFTNNTAANNISVDLGSGQVILASTCTSGVLVARGYGKLVDDSGNHISTGTWNGVTVVNETRSDAGVALSPTQDLRLRELWQLGGLDVAAPLVAKASSLAVASITQSIIGNPEASVTVTRL